MKRFLSRAAFVAAVTALALAFIAPAHGQAEKVKERAKGVKKQVEGTQTNKPPEKTPPPPPQKPAK